MVLININVKVSGMNLSREAFWEKIEVYTCRDADSSVQKGLKNPDQ